MTTRERILQLMGRGMHTQLDVWRMLQGAGVTIGQSSVREMMRRMVDSGELEHLGRNRRRQPVYRRLKNPGVLRTVRPLTAVDRFLGRAL